MLQASITGRLGSEQKHLRNGGMLLSVAVSTPPRKQGDDFGTLWVKVIVGERRAETLANNRNLQKGALIVASGSIAISVWNSDRDGPVPDVALFASSIEVHKPQPRDGNDMHAPQRKSSSSDYAKASGGTAKRVDSFDEMDDDIPF